MGSFRLKLRFDLLLLVLALASHSLFVLESLALASVGKQLGSFCFVSLLLLLLVLDALFERLLNRIEKVAKIVGRFFLELADLRTPSLEALVASVAQQGD